MDESIRIISEGPVTLQYCVPFRFKDNCFTQVNDDFASAKDRRGTACLWQETAFPMRNNTFIYDHVMSMMNVRQSENSVCRSWLLTKPVKHRYLFIDPEGAELAFTFFDIRTHLFRTGIGLLCFQIEFEKGCLQYAGQLISFQQRFKNLYRSDKTLKVSYPPSGPEGEPVRRSVRLGEIIAHLLHDNTSHAIRFFGAAEEDPVPSTALLFSYLCYDCPDRSNLREITVHMSMGYNRQRSQSQGAILSCQELADNVYFYASPGGCAVSVCPDELNSNFFVKNPPRMTYWFIFLITIYQHCSLLNFTTRICNDFPSDTQAYLQNSDWADRMQDYTTDIDTFLMKSDIAAVSHVQYHNLFYTACRKALHIEEDIGSIRSGFESLVNIQRSMQLNRQKQNWHEQELQYREEQENQEKMNLKINIIAIIFALLAFFPELGSFITRLVTLCTKGPSALDTGDYISMGLFVTAAAVSLGLLIYLMKKKPSGE